MPLIKVDLNNVKITTHFILKDKSSEVFPIRGRDIVVVFGVPQIGKSAFLLSLCGCVLLKNNAVKIAYIDIEGKDELRAAVIKKLSDGFEYIRTTDDVSKDDIISFIKSSDYNIYVVDSYHLLFSNDKKYTQFYYELRSEALKNNKAIILASKEYSFNDVVAPHGCSVAFANSNYSVRITRDRDDNNNKKKKNDDIIDPFRVISETRYGRKGVFKLKEYEGHLFFDFFVNRVVRVGGVDGKVK